MKRFSILLFILFAVLLSVAWSQAPYMIVVNPPAAGNAAFQGAQAPGINSAGTIAGFFSDSKNVMHGFLRTMSGSLVSFDAPGAGTKTIKPFVDTPIGILGGQGTYVTAINDSGTVVGLYVDNNNVFHGFLRNPRGKFTTFDVPGSGTGKGQGTIAGNINATGEIAGTYTDASNVTHGFVRTHTGVITAYDVPGAGTAAGQGTSVGWASSINNEGAVSGWMIDSVNVAHGYLRAADGTFTVFEAKGAGTAPGEGTYAWSITPLGAMTGTYYDASSLEHGFILTSDNFLVQFDVPGAADTVAEGINAWGVVTGNYLDKNGANHGYLRTANGTFKYFDAPLTGTLSGQGTIPLTINNNHYVTGGFIDQDNCVHAFVRVP